MAKFDSIQPDAPEFTINDEMGYERITSGGRFNAPCVECQEPTPWGYILLECPCCSHECLEKLRTAYFTRLRESIETEQRIQRLVEAADQLPTEDLTTADEGETFPDGFKLSPGKSSTMVH